MKKKFSNVWSLAAMLVLASVFVACEKKQDPPQPPVELASSLNPLYVQPLSSSLAAVSDVKTKAVHLLNTSTDELVGHVPLNRAGGAMAVVGNHLFVSNYYAEYDADYTPIVKEGVVSVIDVVSKKLIKEIPDLYNVGLGYGKLCVDGESCIWILTETGLKRLNANTLSVDKSIDLPAGYSNVFATSLDISADKKRLYAVLSQWPNNYVFSFDLTTGTFSTSPVRLNGIAQFYGFQLSPEGTFMVCDAVDWSGVKGKLVEYQPDGTVVRQWETGINPNTLCFLPTESTDRFVLTNEGVFGSSNASLSVVGRNQSIVNDLFRTKNNRTLGDVAQSAAWINGKFYICLNNSGKIEVTDRNFVSIKTVMIRK